MKYNEATFPELNFGISKGMNFNRVLIYPTEKIRAYIKTGNLLILNTIRSKFYVALTRAKYSVGIVFDYDDDTNYITGLTKYRI